MPGYHNHAAPVYTKYIPVFTDDLPFFYENYVIFSATFKVVGSVFDQRHICIKWSAHRARPVEYHINHIEANFFFLKWPRRSFDIEKFFFFQIRNPLNFCHRMASFDFFIVGYIKKLWHFGAHPWHPSPPVACFPELHKPFFEKNMSIRQISLL